MLSRSGPKARILHRPPRRLHKRDTVDIPFLDAVFLTVTFSIASRDILDKFQAL